MDISIKIEDAEHGDFSEFSISRESLELVHTFMLEGRRELGHYADASALEGVTTFQDGVNRLL